MIEYNRFNDITKYTLASFMIPVLVFVISSGNFIYYQYAQYMWVSALGVIVIALFVKYKVRISTTALLLISFLWLHFIITGLRDSALVSDAADVTALRLLAFTIVLLSVDINIIEPFKTSIKRAMPLAVIILAATSIHFLVNPIKIWDRYTYFGAQPNLGGEILFVCGVVFCAYERTYLRQLLIVITLTLMLLLQSRAAIVSLVFLWGMSEVFVYNITKKQLARAFFLSSIIAALFIVLMLVNIEITRFIISFIENRVLLLNDTHRGLGSDFAGRGGTFGRLFELLSKHPVLGGGLDSAAWLSGSDYRIHSGILAIVAEFGVASIFIYGLILRATFKSLKIGRFQCLVILASLIMFFFSARTINLNAFPMIMWLSILPWWSASKNSYNYD